MFLKNSTDQSHAYTLSNTDNYKPCISASLNEILHKYISVIVNYMKLMSEKVYIKKQTYYKFIFTRGLDTVTSVFKLLLLFTKNTELTYYHSQKAFYFYIEFIEQISNDQNTFLQLSSREACTFVYKKTIFEINNEFRKNMPNLVPNDMVVFSLLDKYLIMYKNICVFGIYHSEFDFNNITEIIDNYCNKIKQSSDQINYSLGNDYLECIYLFVNYLLDKQLSITNMFQLFQLFVKKITSNKYENYGHLHKSIKYKICMDDLSEKLNIFNSNYNYNPSVIIDWICDKPNLS